MSHGPIPAPALAALLAPLDGWEARWHRLDAIQQRDVAAALALVRATLDSASIGGFAIRTFRTGDIGMLAARQSILYAQSHGWMRKLEIIEGEVTVQFLRGFCEGREQCWIAEIDGAMAGSVLVTDEGGYRRVTLWTHTVLAAARRIYARHGFHVVATAVHHEFGEPVEGETWNLELSPQPRISML